MSENQIDFQGCPHFNRYELTEAQVEELADLAAKKALALGKKELQQEIGEGTINFGKTVLSKLLWCVGAAALALIFAGKQIDFSHFIK